jgi:hypothetical protein
LLGGWYGYAPFICYDYDTDTLYYINFAGNPVWGHRNDNFLYSYKNGVRQVVVEMPVNCPVYHDGVIYFISHEDIHLLQSWYYFPAGYIYKYTIHTQTVERFGSMLAYGLVVYDDYLYFYQPWGADDTESGNPVGGRYRIPLSGGEPESIGDFLPFYYGEYQLKLLINEEGKQSLVLYSSQNTVTVVDFHYIVFYPSYVDFRNGRNFCLYGDNLFFRYRSGFISVNLRNGEITHYHYLDAWGEEINIASITYVGDTLYALIQMERNLRVLCVFNNENNQFEEIDTGDLDLSNAGGTHTDGTFIYTSVVGGRSWPSNRVSIIQINRTEDGPYQGRVIN